MPPRKAVVTDLDEETPEEEVVEETKSKPAEVVEEVVEDDEDVEPEDSDELWDGGPTFGDVKVWKAQFGEENVFVSLINPGLNKYCVWRTLDRHEYRELVKKLENTIAAGEVSETEATMNNEEDIAALCVLYPPYNKFERRKTTAGFPKLIANDVMEQSGFVEVEVRQL